jgi:hypothetical protein
MNTPNIHPTRLSLPLAWSALLGACGSGPPSTDQVNAALKELPKMQLQLGSQCNNPHFTLPRIRHVTSREIKNQV